MNEESEAASRSIGQRAKLAMKSGLLLLAAGLLLVASGKMRGRIDLSSIQRRLPQGRRLVFTSNGKAGSMKGTDRQEPFTPGDQLEIT